MGFSFKSLIFFSSSLILLQCLQSIQGNLNNIKQIPDNHIQDKDSDNTLEPELNVFFHYNDLKLGAKLPIYFPAKNSNTRPHLLSRQESESIPFSSSQLHDILKLFAFPGGSRQAAAIDTTLRHCEVQPMNRETKFCATSLESMLDSVRAIYGDDRQIRVLTTNYICQPMAPLQNYTVSEPVEEIRAPRIVSCHMLPYPYAVFYCHSQDGDRVLYRAALTGEDGGRVDSLAICHMDTSQWDGEHVAFRVLKTAPGASPVCHFFPADNLVWVPM